MSASTSLLLALSVGVFLIATPVAAFGAGDIVDLAKINAVNYRHGDIENTLLELIMVAGGNTKFDKLDVKRVYFGNWLRDYSQAIDVGGLKQLPAETIRILLWCLSFLTFGFATGEFEVTADRLGCYRPEEHIDNPKDYADNEDAREYDRRLRAPVDEEKELAIDPETGLKVYIASENAGCQTSAGLVRNLFEQSIELGRKYNRDHDKNDLYEALRLLGTGLHCLEDYAAHSNYTELALRELGVDAFPHVGKCTELDIGGKKIFPLVTGTFGMTDFLHSVVGEMGDKVAQSEIEGLESQLNSASEEDEKEDKTSFLKSILDNVPWDMLEGDSKPDTSKADELKEASAAKKQEIAQNPLDPNASLGGVDIEQAKETAQQTLKDMYPILEFHDQVMKGVTEIISKVPGLDDLLENMSGALQIFIFSLLAPYVTPIIAQARIELKSTSEGVLKSSEKGQYEVFENDNSTDPTHSMLSKDHFSNVLNPVAGQIACNTVKFVVPHIVDSWSDEGKDVRETIDEILQVFHHPALRDENREGQKAMFDTVRDWWEGKDESEQEHYKEILSAEGVKEGKNHEGENSEGGHSHGAPQKKKKNENEFVPSAQEGASVLSDLAGGLTGLVLEKTGLDKEFGSVGENQRQSDQSSYGRSDNTYGGSGRDEGISGNSYGQSGRFERNNNEESAYGGGGRSEHNDESENTYGGGRYNRNDNEENLFGGFSGRTEENENTYGQSGRSGRGDHEESSHGGGRSYRNDNEESLYNGQSGRIEESENTYSSRDDNQESSGYERSGREEQSSGYGRSGREENEQSYGYAGGREESSGYGGYNREGNEGSGYGRGGREDNEDYGGGRGGHNESSGYGRGGREDNEERSSGYGRRDGHSFGEEDESNSRY
ncbi:heterokaryon incompatibility protein Het-C [Diplocarpon rosae]|nr:heterokaryon incompatibility protein Het-C [Diplocarpon rosae]